MSNWSEELEREHAREDAIIWFRWGMTSQQYASLTQIEVQEYDELFKEIQKKGANLR